MSIRKDIEIISSASGKSGLTLKNFQDKILATSSTGEVIDAAAKVKEIADASANTKFTESNKTNTLTPTQTTGKEIATFNIGGKTGSIKVPTSDIALNLEGNTLTLTYKNADGTTSNATLDLTAIAGTTDINVQSAEYNAENSIITIIETDGSRHTVDLTKLKIVSSNQGGVVTLRQGDTVVVNNVASTDFVTTKINEAKADTIAKRHTETVTLEANVDKVLTIPFTANTYVVQVYDGVTNELVAISIKQVGNQVTLNSTVAGSHRVVVL